MKTPNATRAASHPWSVAYQPPLAEDNVHFDSERSIATPRIFPRHAHAVGYIVYRIFRVETKETSRVRVSKVNL